jgi:hypothetical protein
MKNTLRGKFYFSRHVVEAQRSNGENRAKLLPEL